MRKLLISIYSLIIIISMMTSVKAATTGHITLTPSTDTIKAGTEFSITVKASDSNNLNTVEYSSITVTDANGSVNNNITVKGIETMGDWSKMNNDGNTAFVFGGSATQSQDVFKITFIANSEIAAGTYNINIDGLVIYSTNLEDDTTTIGKKTVSVKVKEEKTQEDKTQEGNKDDSSNKENNEANKGENKPGNNSNNNNNNSNKPNNSTNKPATKLPQTGLIDMTAIAIAVLSIIIVVSYISYRKVKDI